MTVALWFIKPYRTFWEKKKSVTWSNSWTYVQHNSVCYISQHACHLVLSALFLCESNHAFAWQRVRPWEDHRISPYRNEKQTTVTNYWPLSRAAGWQRAREGGGRAQRRAQLRVLSVSGEGTRHEPGPVMEQPGGGVQERMLDDLEECRAQPMKSLPHSIQMHLMSVSNFLFSFELNSFFQEI